MKGLSMTIAQAKAHAFRHGYVLDEARKGVTAANQTKRAGEAVVACKSQGKAPNRTESEYGLILKAQFPKSNVRYEAYTLKLADGCRYTPDWAVEHPDGTLEFYEVKGAFVFSKALTKPRAAAELFPQRFTLAQKLKSGWEITLLRGKIDRRIAELLEGCGLKRRRPLVEIINEAKSVPEQIFQGIKRK